MRNAELHRVQQDQSQNVDALAHTCGDSSRSHLSWVLPPRGSTIHRRWIPFTARLELHSTFVGSSKDRLDAVDTDLKVLHVTSVFGPYAKFLVEEIGGRESTNSEGERYLK